MRKIVEKGYERARKVLTDHLDELHKVAKALLEYEMLSGDEIKALLRGEPIIRDDSGTVSADGKPKSSVPTSGGVLPQGA